MSAINNQNYQYYQGYHDIGLYFLMLYIQNFHTGISVFQRFSEFYLKENLTKHSNIKDNKGYDFTKILDIFQDLVTLINPSVGEILQNTCDGKAVFVLSWIICLFTHDVMNSSIQYRLFDFFITHNPIAVYHVAANILIDEILKMNNSDELVL
jgi:hypothetical protein